MAVPRVNNKIMRLRWWRRDGQRNVPYPEGILISSMIRMIPSIEKALHVKIEDSPQREMPFVKKVFTSATSSTYIHSGVHRKFTSTSLLQRDLPHKDIRLHKR